MNKDKNQMRPMVIRETIYEAVRQPKHEITTKGTSIFVDDDSFMLPEKKQKLMFQDKAIICILDDGTKGVAKCNDDDDYNQTIGIKIAYIRAKIKSLIKELNELTSMKHVMKIKR